MQDDNRVTTSNEGQPGVTTGELSTLFLQNKQGVYLTNQTPL